MRSLDSGLLSELGRGRSVISISSDDKVELFQAQALAGAEQFGLNLLEPSEFLRLIGELP
jgi:hypothetical protein